MSWLERLLGVLGAASGFVTRGCGTKINIGAGVTADLGAASATPAHRAGTKIRTRRLTTLPLLALGAPAALHPSLLPNPPDS